MIQLSYAILTRLVLAKALSSSSTRGHGAQFEPQKMSQEGTKNSADTRALLLLGGPDLMWTQNLMMTSSRFYEPLPSGPYKGKPP